MARCLSVLSKVWMEHDPVEANPGRPCGSFVRHAAHNVSADRLVSASKTVIPSRPLVTNRFPSARDIASAAEANLAPPPQDKPSAPQPQGAEVQTPPLSVWFEDLAVGAKTALGSETFTRESMSCAGSWCRSASWTHAVVGARGSGSFRWATSSIATPPRRPICAPPAWPPRTSTIPTNSCPGTP